MAQQVPQGRCERSRSEVHRINTGGVWQPWARPALWHRCLCLSRTCSIVKPAKLALNMFVVSRASVPAIIDCERLNMVVSDRSGICACFLQSFEQEREKRFTSLHPATLQADAQSCLTVRTKFFDGTHKDMTVRTKLFYGTHSNITVHTEL